MGSSDDNDENTRPPNTNLQGNLDGENKVLIGKKKN